MSPETTPDKGAVFSIFPQSLSLQDLIAVAMTEKELPKGFGDHLKSVASDASQVRPVQDPPSPVTSTMQARYSPPWRK
jgi:hypothetical protein